MTQVIQPRQHITIRPDVLVRLVGDEAVILHLNSEIYFGLDPIGTRMWVLLTTSPTIQQAYDTLLGEYDVLPEKLRQDMLDLINNLHQNDLISIVDA